MKIENAKEMLRLSTEKEGKSVAMMKGKFIEPPMVATAKKVLKKHNLRKSTGK